MMRLSFQFLSRSFLFLSFYLVHLLVNVIFFSVSQQHLRIAFALVVLSSFNAKTLTVVPVTTATPYRRILLPQPSRGFIDREINKIIEALDRKNISDHILLKIANITPPIERSPGINSFTRLVQNLPDNVKESIINAIPNKAIDFPGTQLWEAVADKWLQTQETSNHIHQKLETMGILDTVKEGVKSYNKLMDWRTEMPFNVYDTKVVAFRNITKPLYDTRTKFIESRDAVLDSFLGRQKTTWQPIVNKSADIGEAVEKTRMRISEAADQRLLGRLSNTLFDLRSFMLGFNTNRIYTKNAAKMCALNPVCCKDPSRCVPSEMNQKF